MGKNTRIEILTENRIGMTEDILKELHKQNIDLVSMEVQAKRIGMMVEHLGSQQLISLMAAIKEISGVQAISPIELLEFEKINKHLLAIINAVDEGILAVDEENHIRLFNHYCERLFDMDESAVIGKPVEELFGDEARIVKLIHDGEVYDNAACCLTLDGGQINYLSTGRVIKTDGGDVRGAVASIKDIVKVKALIQALTPDESTVFTDLIGHSQSLEKCKRVAKAAASSHAPVLIRGESGTGKEIFAHGIHKLSKRNGQFVTINCAALPEQLIESELFGYEKGSFTGAYQSRGGLFEEAEGGTLFLDEIGEMPLSTQAKLLRVLQNGVVRRIGSRQEKKIEVRIVAATHRPLEKLIKENRFREDLYYRLNVLPIELPNLRDRKEDIPLLVNHFIGNCCKRMNRPVIGYDAGFMEAIIKHEWPGNVRELQNAIERGVSLCEYNILTTKDLDFMSNVGQNEVNGVDEWTEKSLENLKRDQLLPATQKPLTEVVDDFEKNYLRQILGKYSSVRGMAKALGVSHTTIQNKLKRYGLEK